MVALTWPLEGEYVAFQPEVIDWPEGSVNLRVQPLIVEVPVLVIVMLAVNPEFHVFIV